jgi:hypothetical protein
MDEQYIPGIYNYCDRWCERCSFTRRCRVFSDESDLTEEQRDMNHEAFWQYLNESLQKALDLIEKHLEEMGIDWESFKEEGLEEKEQDNSFELPPDHEALHNLSVNYYEKAKEWFEEYHHLFRQKEESLQRQLDLGMPVMPEAVQLSDALDVINWYSFFISSKLRRALHGLRDEYMLREFPIQNDANGNAKVTLLAINRSLTAWEVIRTAFPHATNEMLELLLILGRLRRGILKLFPDADRFVRPGFDEPEYLEV